MSEKEHDHAPAEGSKERKRVARSFDDTLFVRKLPETKHDARKKVQHNLEDESTVLQENRTDKTNE